MTQNLVVLISGPPGSGKDTLADALCLSVRPQRVHRMEFKKVLFRIVRKHYKISSERWEELYRRENKEIPQKELGDISPRAAMIHVSENIIKPTHGNDYFARCLAWDIKHAIQEAPDTSNVFVVSDCGFQEEVTTLSHDLGAANVLLVRMHRKGCTFANDSRDYVYDTACPSIDVYNREGQQDITSELVRDWINTWT